MMNLNFPPKLEEAIQATENAKQEAERYARLEEREFSLKNTRIELAKITKEIIKSKADAIKSEAEIYKDGEFEGSKYIWEKYEKALTKLQAEIEPATDIGTYATEYLLIKILENNWNTTLIHLGVHKSFP